MFRRTRQRRVTIGDVDVVKIGMPSARADLYYSIMEMGWVPFVAWVAAVFVALNLFFGIIYACLPGAIYALPPHDVAFGFFFSVETLGTVGYGNMAPVTWVGHSIAAVEIMIGLFYSATVTGLIFARFARPRTGFVFSAKAVIGLWETKPALKVQIASGRAPPVADVAAQMSWSDRVEQPDGRIVRHVTDLPLVSARVPSLGLTWMLVHVLPDNSPFLAALAGTQQFRLSVEVSGVDTLLATQAIGNHNYTRADILYDHEFVDALRSDHGRFELDLRKLDEVVARSAPTPASGIAAGPAAPLAAPTKHE